MQQDLSRDGCSFNERVDIYHIQHKLFHCLRTSSKCSGFRHIKKKQETDKTTFPPCNYRSAN